jgi:hypothetical protein
MVEQKLLQQLTREVRNAAGIERTPSQVFQWLTQNTKRPRSFVQKVLADPDAVQELASRMKIPFLESAPPSTEWG